LQNIANDINVLPSDVPECVKRTWR